MNRNKTVIVVAALLIILIAVLTAGCGQTQLTKVNDNDKEQSQEFPKTIVDDMGREVVINKQPQRIVSLAPSNTEILFALELTDQIVGVTEYCNYPEEALTKTKVGSFSEPNIEKIVELEPDLVFATSMHKKTVEQLEKLDISVFVVNPSNISEIINSIKKVGDATGRSEAAGQLTADMQSRIEAVKEKTEKLKEEDKPLVYYELWDDPVMSAGPGSFVDSLITLAGGINLAGDAEGKYPKLSEEVVIERNPDIIIHQYDHGSNKIENIADRPGWQNITAIKQGKIYGIDPDIVNRPGPRIVDALEKFFEYIHPELAK